MENQPTRHRRPFGVYAVIVLLLLNLLSNSFDVLRVRLGFAPLVLPNFDNLAVITVLNGVIIAIVVIVCIGLFLLKRWAWITAMILIGFSLVYTIVHYLNGGQPFASMLLDVVSVFYLNLRNVQLAFENRPAPPEAVA
jgi:hypothetical protein